MKKIYTFSVLFFLILIHSSFAGEVLLVIGSDTAIWEGMNTRKYNCTYNPSLYIDPSRNAYGVMAPDFREPLVDSYGNTLKMTWWMMAGNIFRYATNTNIPVPNIMTMFLIKTYHGDMIERWGDELSLHYHTFFWSDYDGDGIYWWNQSETFMECKDDFDYTLSQFLLEENVFPVSFRSGWHYMDNDWQHYLNELLPYSMHNASPFHGVDQEEPLDNNYDWSQSPRVFVPFHVSNENYQVPGDSKGWNVRSIHFGHAIAINILDYIFEQASFGFDQLACIWGHLPESDFLTNIQKLDQLAHEAEAKYPNVKFRYCTAIEAMQRWRGQTDAEAPQISAEIDQIGDNLELTIESDEPLFQPKPFVALKDIYENYWVPEITQIGDNVWQISEEVNYGRLAKLGISVCDTMGNQTNECINFIPDDIYIDNECDGYYEISGEWQTQSDFVWGTNSRITPVADSVEVRWSFEIPETRLYNIFIQFPQTENMVDDIIVELYCGRLALDTVAIRGDIKPNEWIYCGSGEMMSGNTGSIHLKANNEHSIGKYLAVDAVKISSYIRDFDIYVNQESIDFGEVGLGDTVTSKVVLSNHGNKDLTISKIYTASEYVGSSVEIPFSIKAMESFELPVSFYPESKGLFKDTLYIENNDPIEPIIKLQITAHVQNPFVIIDNEDEEHYWEYGDWNYSVTYAYGGTSRYSFLNRSPDAYAVFSITMQESGFYEIFEVVPKTTNSTNDAVYYIEVAGVLVDSVRINQNEGSADWVSLGTCRVTAGETLQVRVCKSGEHTYGDVLRADAIKVALLQEITTVSEENPADLPKQFVLQQNYPNPFNPRTTVEFYLPEENEISIKIYNIRGEIVQEYDDVYYNMGHNKFVWDGKSMHGTETASGMYICTMKYDSKVSSIKMIKLQ